jgi:hypothetical protein
MGTLHRLTAVATLLALLPLAAYAQADRAFAGEFVFNDRNGTGTLTITPLAGDSTGAGIQRVEVSLAQGGQTLSGSGAYYAPDGGAANPSLPALLSFGLLDSSGRGYYFQARLTQQGDRQVGQGTYILLAEPRTEFAWSIEGQTSDSGSGVEPIVSSQPTFQGGDWTRVTLAEAIGGVYFATDNQASAAAKTATWTGGLPAAGLYRVEVFIPALQAGAAPRTESATYRLSGGLTDSQVRSASQNVTTSQWVDLGTFTFGTNYEIVLTDQTREPAFTRSVVANAVRLTPVSSAS